MAEILLLYSAGTKGAATRLAEAIAGEGHEVIQKEVFASSGIAAIADKAIGAQAALLVWSRDLIATAMTQGGLAKLRKQTNIVEVSADGLMPPAAEDRVILISGWRGQPFHPGWQRVQAALDGLCGPVGTSSRKIASAAPGAKPPSALPLPAGSGKQGFGLPRVAAPALLLLPLAAATAAWLGFSSPEKHPVAAAAPASAYVRQAQIAQSQPTAVQAAAESIENAVEPQPTGDPAAPPAGPAARSQAAPAPGSTISLSRQSATPGPRPAAQFASLKQRLKPQPAAKRYSSRNSAPMRLFCARSGRFTPQCREFQRAMGRLGN